MDAVEGRGTTATTTGTEQTRPHVLLGCAGSVATVKAAELAAALCAFADVRLVVSPHAMHFFARSEEYNAQAWARFEQCQRDGRVQLVVDDDEWSSWQRLKDPVLHIELRKWADVFVIAPASANKLSEFAHGACPDLLSCIVRAWDESKPVVLAPAMNTHMWSHPMTQEHLDAVTALYTCHVVPPASKVLACGDVGTGAMAAVADIVEAVRDTLKHGETQPPQGRKQCEACGWRILLAIGVMAGLALWAASSPPSSRTPRRR